MLLAGQRILLIGIGFYDYETAIAAEMQALGGEVWVESQRPAARRLWGRFQRASEVSAMARHRVALLQRIQTLGPLDHVVVIKGDLLDKEFVKNLRAAQPTAQLTAYHWDSMARYPELVARQVQYDRVLTFDHIDAESNPGFLLRPLFYRPELTAVTSSSRPVDLCFIGWLHHDRLAQIVAIEQQAHMLGLTTCIYLSTGWRTKLQLTLSGDGRHVHAKPIAFADYVQATTAARAIVDLPHPMQAGLTMRAIETVGAHRRLLTTGRSIAAYNVFAEGNVTILNPSALSIDAELVRAPVKPITSDIVEQYSLRTWVTDVLGVTRPGPFLTVRGDAKAAA